MWILFCVCVFVLCGVAVWRYVVWRVYIVAQSIHLNRDLWRVILESSSTLLSWTRKRSLAHSFKHKNTNTLHVIDFHECLSYMPHNIPYRAKTIPFLEQTYKFFFSTGQMLRSLRLLLLCFFHRTLFVILFASSYVSFVIWPYASSLVWYFCRHFALIVFIYDRINWLLSLLLCVFQFDAEAFQLFLFLLSWI